ncbi:MAG: hypothetical protein ABL995_16935 [Bryobacteraceae bacterium]
MLAALVGAATAAFAQAQPAAVRLPRAANGKPNLQGIWQVNARAAYDLEDHASRLGMPAGRSVVEGDVIPYQPWAAAKKIENFKNRASADPVGKCYFPGVPRIMYMEHPFQIFQTGEHVAILFEWSHVYRLIYTNGKPPLHDGIESWMGDSRGHWEGDTLVVEVKGQNDKTWFDMAGNFHSGEMKVVERYTMQSADAMQYEATIEDSKVFTKPWKIRVPLRRQTGLDRILEYQCQAEKEEANGEFEREPKTWYPDAGSEVVVPAFTGTQEPDVAPAKTGTNLRRMADGKPNITGYYQPDAGGANYGLERHEKVFLTPASRGLVIDPKDGLLPYQPWARQERIEREKPYRGYDDPTAHCFPAGVPRGFYAPAPYQILQTPGYVVFLFERMAWRIVPLNRRTHLRDNVRLWQGDSIGHWEGDVLVVETTNLNGKTWLNEVGDVVSHAARVVERFYPVDANQVIYRATVSDPVVYTRPWTIEIPLNREPEELLEVACHEDNGDLQHLKDVRDEYRAQQKKAQ